MKQIFLTVLFFLYPLLCIVGCGPSDKVAGGGTEVPNSISGTLLDAGNNPVAMRPVALARLSLNLSDENPSVLKTDTTNEKGSFIFENLSAGKYVLSTPISSEALSLPRTVVDLKADSAVGLKNLALQPKLSLTGSIHIPETFTLDQLSIFVTGMELPVEIQESGRFTISEVPTGPLEIIFLLGDLVNSLKLEIENSEADILELAPLEFVFFNSKSEGSNEDYIEEREESYQILPVELSPESPIHYYYENEEGQEIFVEQIEDKAGEIYPGEIAQSETGFVVNVSSEIIFSLDHLELDFTPQDGQQVVILVIEDSVTEIKLLEEHGLSHSVE